MQRDITHSFPSPPTGGATIFNNNFPREHQGQKCPGMGGQDTQTVLVFLSQHGETRTGGQ